MKNVTRSLVFFFVLVAVAVPFVSKAAMVINEVMYDAPSPGADDGREWVEIWNNGSEPTDLVGWKFFEEGVNHALTPMGESVIAPGGFAVIVADPAKFAADWPGSSLTIFDSSFSLKNTGEALSLKNDSGEVINTITYDPTLGAGGDGASLQLVAGSWLAASPTPGAVNGSTPVMPPSSESTITPSTTTTDDTDSGPLSAHESPAPVSQVMPLEPFKVGAGRPRLASVHSPVAFRVELAGTIPQTVRHQWSFGDGGRAVGEQVNHIYYFPGEYNVILNAVDSDGKAAVGRTTVSIIQPLVSLGSVLNDRVEITNRAARELNLGGWRIIQGASAFTFPSDTIVAVGKGTMIPAVNLGFSPVPNLPLALAFPDGVVAFAAAPAPSREALEIMVQSLRQLSAKLTAFEISRRALATRSAPPSPARGTQSTPVTVTIPSTTTEQLTSTTLPPPTAAVATIPVPKSPGFFARIKHWFGK